MKRATMISVVGLVLMMLTISYSAAFDINTELSDAPVSYRGATTYGYAGWSISTGDVDGDGINDIVIGGSPVYVILGKNIGKTTGSNIESIADASFLAETYGDSFGHAVCAAGDLNNDGFNDILIGAQRHDSMTGKTYLVWGRADGWAKNVNISAVAGAAFLGENQNDWSGHSVSFVGDVNNDGFDDLIVGAYMVPDSNLINVGRSYLFFGKSTGWFLDTSLAEADVVFDGTSETSGSGKKVCAAGDVNNDGFSDFLIGSSAGARGKTYLFLGRAEGWPRFTNLAAADASFIGEYGGDNSGIAISGAGDVNGDGYDDFLIGADENDISGARAGKAYLIFGKASGWSMNTSLSLSGASFLAEMPGDHLGKSVSSAGDVNGDGYDDFLLSATSADQYAGKTYLVYGKQAGWINNDNIAGADASFLGEHSFGYAGFALAAAGDLNRDGCDDFLISAPYYGSYSSQIGKTYLFYSDTPCDADLDQDRDIDGVDLAIFSAQTVLVNLKIMASGFGSTNCSL